MCITVTCCLCWQIMCSENDLKDIGIAMGPRKKLLGLVKEEQERKVYSFSVIFCILILPIPFNSQLDRRPSINSLILILEINIMALRAYS